MMTVLGSLARPSENSNLATLGLNTYILLDDLVCSIVGYFCESSCILTSPLGESKYERRRQVKISHDTIH